MARILGIDLGAYSVKVAVVTAGLRRNAVVDWLEQPVPPGPEPVEERAARLLGEMLRARGVEHDIPYATIGGEALSLRALDFPFKGLKRVDLEKAVGAELEAQLPHELDEIVYAFDVIPAETEGTRVFAAAITRERIQRLLELTQREQCEPHAVLAAPTTYARVAGQLSAFGGDEAAFDPVMLVDHGHARTNVAILRAGRVIFARTIARGGRHVTQAIMRAWSMSWEDAERAKHSDGFIASSREPSPSDAWSRISDVLRTELQPLVRELRQTLAACRAQTGAVVTRAILAGGGGRLRGLGGFLADELELPVGHVTPDDGLRLLGPNLANRGVAVDTALLALGTALEGATGRPAFDLRQGPLAYKHDFTFLRAKAGVLTGCALALIALFAGTAYANLYKLRAEQALLDRRLASETTEVFGAPVGPDELEARLQPKKEESPLPKMTAFDVLVEMSKHLPARTEGKLDVLELEIDQKKIGVKAIADSSATIDTVVKKLKELDCVTDVQKGREDAVSDGKQFTLTIQHKCM